MTLFSRMLIAMIGGPALYLLACAAWRFPGTAAAIVGVICLPFVGAFLWGAGRALDAHGERKRRDADADARAVIDRLRPR